MFYIVSLFGSSRLLDVEYEGLSQKVAARLLAQTVKQQPVYSEPPGGVVGGEALTLDSRHGVIGGAGSA